MTRKTVQLSFHKVSHNYIAEIGTFQHLQICIPQLLRIARRNQNEDVGRRGIRTSKSKTHSFTHNNLDLIRYYKSKSAPILD